MTKENILAIQQKIKEILTDVNFESKWNYIYNKMIKTKFERDTSGKLIKANSIYN